MAVKHSKEAGKIEMFGLKKAASESKNFYLLITSKTSIFSLQTLFRVPLVRILKKKKHVGGPAPESVKKMIHNQKKN